jgi:hypothetical protein
VCYCTCTMAEVLSWDKTIDKDVKSRDDEKIGKIKAITTDFIQIEKGKLDKKCYFVPKHYIQGYDGDHIWISLSKGEVKQFESEKELSASALDNEQYRQRKAFVERQHPEFSSAIPAYSQTSSPQNLVGMPWEKIIGKDVKSADDKDLGEVKSIAAEYVEVKEGAVSKKYYFVPKMFVQEYDGKKVHVSLTKDEVKQRFERDEPPLASEFESKEYADLSKQYESKYPQYHELIPLMAKEPGLLMQGKESGDILHIPWEEVIHKHVMTSDNIDMGDVDRVGNEFIVVREGVVKVHLYYIPKQYINNYDGSSLYINVPSGLVGAKFERESEPTQQEIEMMAKDADKKSSQTDLK